ncbi:hypothetical protein [Microvirga makkahensis]|uniref:hypothetical protein n=1 Tax=Microvirga makkahensis TaxID=1128670 RepID=UPI0013684716|nr:hypothetical protein [Microvirga makkahensis]
MQVEEEVKSVWSLFSRQPKFRKRWRDAKAMDLPAAELRALMDLRNRPRFVTQAFEPTQVVRPAPRMEEPALSVRTVPEEVRSVATH